MIALLAPQQQVATCRHAVLGYTHNLSTPAQQVQYAECIEVLHPISFGTAELVVVKIAMIVLLAAMLAGAWSGRAKSPYSGFTSAVAGATAGAMVAAFWIAFIAGAVFLVRSL